VCYTASSFVAAPPCSRTDFKPAHKCFNDIHKSFDPFKLLEIIREIVYTTEDTAFPPHFVFEQLEVIMAARQGSLSISTKYHAQFKSMIEAKLTGGGAIELHPCISNMVAKEMYPEVASGRQLH
jgi:hypothetical protein